MNKHSENTKPDTCDNNVLANRLFKFRAWVKEQNRMIKVFGFNEHLVFEQTWDSPSIKENIFEIEDCHIMQFTGLIDKNGTEIYEGDINQYGYVIKYCEEKALFGEYGTRNGIDYDILMSYPIDSKSQIIKGNIYENPELLEKKFED